MTLNQERVREKVFAERWRQNVLWGQKHDIRHDDRGWLLILLKQVGGLSQAILNGGNDISNQDTEVELVQAAAVMLAWLESREEATE